ncbi:alpha/beta fold hydrolase [Cohnella cholangitidis]|uniref:Alpha/beta hydrolase n=1 Tax=Cohnella cholangitidis TaxID=2598458 RepID=A0A7G5C0F4_9BACL|nr:alpha/beta hydrolase [Cohnella cholangitidis]QMV42688.1 alpha/beta hydrolase [Cohnella cholangitidis]
MIQDYLVSGDARLFYTVSGKGNPLILLHGNFNDHRIWDEQAVALAGYYQVIRYDLRGYGRSSTPNSAFSHVEDLKALIDALGLSKVSLIGSSLGGGIAMDFALAHPDLVHALILVAPSINGKSYPFAMTWHGIKNYINVRFRGREAAIESFIQSRYWQYFFPSLHKNHARERVLDNVRNPDNFCRFPPHLSTAIKPYAAKRLREISTPACIIVSDQDHPYNIKTADTLHEEIKSASKVVMTGCGHLPFVEEPYEFNEIVLGFLDELEA